MHELALAQSVVQILCEEAQRHQLQKVERIRIEIGMLRGVVPEFMKTCMIAVSQDTVAEGVEVELVEIPARARCLSCQAEFEITEYIFLCPSCGSLGGNVISGEELSLVELEGE